jgi:transposase-like protein
MYPENMKRDRKTPVVGVVQRGGDVRFRVMPRVTAAHLREFIAENADRSCRIITDDLNAYKGVGTAFSGGHYTVHHTRKEYVRWGTDIHSNTIEGVFSLLRRGIMGTFHSVSRKHLPNYLNEFQFRWNTRKLDDGERVARAIKQADGKRLQYRESVDNPPYLVANGGAE